MISRLFKESFSMYSMACENRLLESPRSLSVDEIKSFVSLIIHVANFSIELNIGIAMITPSRVTVGNFNEFTVLKAIKVGTHNISQNSNVWA